jgi:hypothetical protein
MKETPKELTGHNRISIKSLDPDWQGLVRVAPSHSYTTPQVTINLEEGRISEVS